MPGAFSATTPDRLPDILVGHLFPAGSPRDPRPTTEPEAAPGAGGGPAVEADRQHPTRVAVDGPLCAHPHRLAAEMADRLQRAGRPPVVVAAASYWRDASLRLEFGHTDADAYFTGWLDGDALTREVLQPLGPDGDRRYLPELRDPLTNRSVRAAYRTAAADTVLLVPGDLLLGRDLPFDVTIHLALSAPARRRRTAAESAWTLPALERYDAEVDPVAVADIVVSWNDPARPAVRFAIPRR